MSTPNPLTRCWCHHIRHVHDGAGAGSCSEWGCRCAQFVEALP